MNNLNRCVSLGVVVEEIGEAGVDHDVEREVFVGKDLEFDLIDEAHAKEDAVVIV